jgi:type VI secretion system protein
MKTTSLLTRIRHPELAESRRRVLDSEVRDDILKHLRGICSTRAGTMVTRPDYGLPDISELMVSFPEAIGALQRALKHTIEVYEPRIANVRVNYVASKVEDLIVRFEISGQLATDAGKLPVKFETTLDVTRKVSVR